MLHALKQKILTIAFIVTVITSPVVAEQKDHNLTDAQLNAVMNIITNFILSDTSSTPNPITPPKPIEISVLDTNSTNPTVIGNCTAGNTIKLYDDEVALAPTVICDENDTFSISPNTILEDGNHSLSVTETDSAGNTTSNSIVLHITINPSSVPINSDDFINANKCDQIVNNGFIKICYDYNLKSPTAVSYTLQGDLVNELDIDERPRFKSEQTISRAYRAYYSDYTHSGYDRGHLAPDASFDWSQESLEAVYTLANIIPQAPKINRYTWIKAERYERFVAVQRTTVNVINIVKFDTIPKRIGSHGISVPSGFYKVLYSEDQNYTRCLYYENDNNITISEDRLADHDMDCKEIYSK